MTSCKHIKTSNKKTSKGKEKQLGFRRSNGDYVMITAWQMFFREFFKKNSSRIITDGHNAKIIMNGRDEWQKLNKKQKQKYENRAKRVNKLGYFPKNY